MNGRSAGNSAHRNPAARKGRVVDAQVVAVDKAEAVPVVMVAKVVVVLVGKVVRAEADVRVASAALRRAQRQGSQPRCPNKTRPLTAHGVCGSG